jgi:histidine kinase
MSLSNFTIEKDLIHTHFYSLHTAVSIDKGEYYLIKKIRNIDRNKLVSFKSGIQLAQELKLDFILDPIALYEDGLDATIVYTYFEAISLRTFIKTNKKVKPHEFILISIELIKIVKGFHDRGWIIKNLSPENILINEVNYCKLVDLRKSTKVIKKDSVNNDEKIHLTELQYMSPEQTGRLHQFTDVRSDLYSLGIIFYELLSGMLPFQSQDTLELIHAHLALPVLPLTKIDNLIPKVLNDIILKLLNKSPEERYQSCDGLLYDLDHAVAQFASTSNIQLAKRDKILKIVPTTKLIGRRDELEVLESAYKVAKTGKKQAVYIAGYSGTGKSRIVQEFQKNKVSTNIPFIPSKFDTLQRTIPYSALITAMQDHIKKILLEDEDKIAFWKKRFLENLKSNASIIIDVIPELKILLGSQVPVEPLPPEEAQKRFQQTFISFIGALTTDQHFLILFLDDLQWADIASIKVVEMILLDDNIKNLLFVGAYRDNEVDRTHPLAISLKKQEDWVNLNTIMLQPLQKIDSNELIAQTLHDPIKFQEKFFEIIYLKTGGNTFFILQLLSVLFEENILVRDEEGEWEWDEKKLTEKNISNNVVDVLSKKIENLSPDLQEVIKIGAALGDEFDLKTLATISTKKMNIAANHLSEAVNIGYLISLDENLDGYFRTIVTINEQEFEEFRNTRFKFSHDRIRQASLLQLSNEDLQHINLKAARYKMKILTDAEVENELFYIANHFMEARELITDIEERKQLAAITNRAGQKARKASAFEAAIHYFDVAKSNLTFDKDYTQLHGVYLQQAECNYLTGHYERAEKDLDKLLNVSKSRMDKLNTLFAKVLLHNIQDNKIEAIEAGREGYKLFDISMPRNKWLITLYIFRDLFMSSIKLPESKINKVLSFPLMQDPEQIRLMEFILALSPTIYQYDQNLFVWNFMRMLFPSVNKGNTSISSISYIGYGMLVSQLFGKYRMGKKLADVAIKLNVQNGYTASKWKVLLSYYNFIHHWTDPIRPELDKILEVENGAHANGDPIFAGYAIFIYNQKIFALGYNLAEVQDSFESYMRTVEQRHDIETFHFLQGYYFAIRCLRGLEKDTEVMGSSFDAPRSLQKSIDLSSFTVAADTYIAYMQILYLFGHIEKALVQYEAAKKYIDFIQQRYEFAEFNFYGALICAAAHSKKIPTKTNLIKSLKGHVKKLKLWTEHCPPNFEPQFLIASAELSRVTGSGQQASTLFEKAIDRGEVYQFINYKAIANELAGRYQFGAGNLIMAKTFLTNARNDYGTWGANAKVDQLESEFGNIIGQTASKAVIENRSYTDVNVGIDLNLILQANRAIDSEKDIDQLIGQLMNAIIQYSGADRGFLIVKNELELVIKATYNTTIGTGVVNEYADNDNLPMNIIKYVSRAKEPLIINQPSFTANYGNIRYFQKNKPKSTICHPIIKHGEIFGLLYLENYYNEDVFDSNKIGILNLISTQIAVSLDNAFLYQNLENKVLERTKVLETEKGIADEMLANILPKAAIEELKRTGKTTAQKLDNITVLMADIKGFTNITEKLTPEELIGKIDFYFRSFDAIMEKYKLEKIKTIGDAYMAAGGLDGDAASGAYNMVAASIEMQECMASQNRNNSSADLLELRIGINTGSVIAGVVGTKKFQYDMWGDTVNISARMEQQSEPGKINVAISTYELTNHRVEYIYRGKIEAKNKGPLEMYFVQGLKE